MIYDSVNNVLERLDDPRGERYTRDSVLKNLEQGSDTLLRRTEILWDCEFYDASARTGNVTSRWEQGYLVPLTQATFYCGLLNYTGGHWEKEYLGPEVFHNGASGPAQVTAPWETASHPEAIDQEVFEVPERLVRVDRVSWDYRTLDPQMGNSMRRFYGEFKNHHAGDPRFFVFNEDGLRTLRVSPTMPNTGTVYTYSGSRGILRDDDATTGELGDTTYQGTYGILRATDDHIQCGQLRGHPVRLHADNGNLRVEFFRTTANIEEVPARYVRAIEDFACASALIDEGPGQDRALGALYSARFNGAVDRLRKRVNEIRQQRTASFGGLSGRGSTPYARLPQKYPENGA